MSVSTVIIAGLTGTILMSLVMGLIHATRLANADMIRGVGSMITRSLDNAFPVGLLIHLMVGALFAFPYLYILRSLPVVSLGSQMAAGAALGTFHGVGTAFVLMVLIAEKHPLPHFRKAGFEVGAAHIAGHVAYGLGVGVISAVLQG